MEKWTFRSTQQFFACYCSPPAGGSNSSRMLLRSCSAALIILLTCLQTYGQNLSNRGKSFWVGYGHHQFMEPNRGNSQEMVLYLSAEEPANVTVTIDGTTWSRTYTIPANTVIATDQIPKTGTFDARLYSVPPTFGGTGGEGLFQRKGIHIVSDVPIVAYAHIYGSASSGATMLMPEDTWGYYYVSLNSQQDYDFDCFSWMFVVAKENNTVVEITPSVPTRNGKLPGVPFTVTLNRGEIYQVIGASLGGSAGHEMTGTTVRSIANVNDTCFPVAVFSGSSRTSIACVGNFGSSGDNNIQQVFPSQAWGKRYLTAPSSVDNTPSSFMTNPYKVVVKDPTTVVKRNGVQLTGLLNNAYYEYESSTPDIIEADKPVLVAQYMSSTGACNNTGGDGDPEMVYLSPVEQSIKRIGFYRNNRENINVNYLTMIIPTVGLNTLTIDGVANSWNVAIPHPNVPGYSVVVKRWNATQAQCIVQSDSAFTAVTYGLGSVESYGYNAGTLINNLNVIGVIHNEQDTSSYKNDFTCTQAPVELSVLLAYKPTEMHWNISKLGNVVTPNADVTQVNPVAVGEELVNGVPYYKYTLPGTYLFSTIGKYEIPIVNTHPSIEKCDHKEEVKISVDVKRKPTATFTTDFTGCTMDTVYFKADSSGNGYTIDRWKWTFPGAVKDSGAVVQRRFPVGQQNIQLSVISKEGCLADTVIPVNVVAVPVADFTTAPAAVCEGGSVQLTDQSTYGGTAPMKNWYWDFGNDTTASVDNGAAQKANYSTYGTYTIEHVVKVSELCVSDTVTKTIAVNANPVLGFTYPDTCLLATGEVQFNSTTTVPDGQAISTYAWDFGDANATPANPNTAAIADPLHSYSRFGTYTIKYAVTTAQGCKNDTTVQATFNLKPALTFGATLPAVCINDKTIISVAKANVTNGVTGTGIYKGTGVSQAGIFNPLTAGAGTHTVWYVFTAQGGCTDSISATITVYPKPQTAFTANADVCLGEAVSFADQSSITTGNIVTWKWIFGDGSTENRTDNTTFDKTYTAWKNYNAKLVTVSDHGCISDTAARTVAVHALPVPDFALPTNICMPEGAAQFNNQSAVPDMSTLAYQWTFGDGGTATDASPLHHYQDAGSYTVVLTATSVYGCTATKEKVLADFYAQPMADFTVSPDTLCQGADNVFTDRSVDANNDIVAWAWTFGDGSGSTDRNPVKRYTEPGDYPVQLVVSNGAGCVSVPFTSNVVVYLQPVIDAGPSFIVAQGSQVRFAPTANDSSLSFRWTPPDGLSDPTVLRPVLNAMEDQVYTLTAIGEGGCIATDETSVKVFKKVSIPNVFSPNGDQINDRWVLTNLSDYAECTVEIFNRYGQQVYYSEGYKTPWDGTYKGHLLPQATYYYVIKLNNGTAPMTGYVVILQ